MANGAFIEQLYTQMLGREADTDGTAYWSEQIDNGSLNAAEVTRQFSDSVEFNETVAPIARLYFAAFGRIPDADGLAYWVQQAHQGGSLHAISAAFMDSDEYQHLYGSTEGDDSAFVDQLYQTTFGRAPGGDGTIYWQNALGNNSLSRTDVLVAFASSQELIETKAADINVIGQYHSILNRAPTQAEIDSAISSSDPIGQITQLYSSDQYSGEVVPGLSKAGVVVDGYVRGATVTMIKADGSTVSVITDENGNFDFGADAGFGELVMTGGTDISTGKPFEGTMTAPAGATVVNPITTLIHQYTDIRYGSSASPKKIKKARKDVLEKLGLERNVDALNFDPMKEVSRTDTDSTATESALKFQAAATQINTLVTQVAALLEGAGAAVDESVGGDAAVRALAEIVTTEAVDLSSTEIIKQVTTSAATEAGADASSQARVDTLADEAAQTVANLNQAIQNAVDTAGHNHTGALQEIAQVQVVAEAVEDSLEWGAARDNLTTARESTEGNRFRAAVEAEKDNVSIKNGIGVIYQRKDTEAPTVTLSYSTNTSRTDNSDASSSLAVKQGDTLRIFARFNEGIRDANGATLTLNDGQSDIVSAGIMVKVSSTLYYYDFAIPTGDFTGTVAIAAAKDGAGNTISAAPTNATFTVDNTAPTTTLSGLSLSDDNGSDPSDAVTNITTQTLSATLSQALAADEVLLGSVDGGSNWTNINSKTSGTSLSWDLVSLMDGSNQLQLKVVDGVGNEGAVATLDYALDTDAPTIATLVISSDNLINSSDTLTAVAFSGTTSGVEDGQQVTVNIAGVSQQVSVTGNSFSGTVDLSSVGDGSSLAVTADVSDLAGNAATRFIGTVSKDTAVPVVTGVTFSPATNTLKVGDQLTAIITADAAGYQAGAITINGKAVADFTDNNDSTYSVTYTVASGDTDIADSSPIPLSVVLTDAAGNSSNVYTTAPVAGDAPAVDAHPPSIVTLLVSSDDKVNSSDTLTAVTFSGTTSGVEDNQQVTVAIAGASATATVTSDSFSGTIDLSNVSDGNSLAVTADVSDLAGNAAPQFSNTLVKDSAAPVISHVVFTPSSGALKVGDKLTATIHADGTGYSAGAISINGKAVTGFSDNDDGTYQVTYTVESDDTDIADSGQIPVSVVFTDTAGNSCSAYTTAPAASDAPAVDAHPPSITTMAVSSDDAVNSTDPLTEVAFSGTTSGVEDGQQVTVDIAGASATATVTGNSFNSTIDLSGVSDGSSLAVTADVSDAAGNAATQFSTSLSMDTAAPTVTEVAISSATGAQNDTLNAGDTVSVTVTMSEKTAVTGTPQLALKIGGDTVQADYASGSDSTQLVFTYNIQANQTDSDGISIDANSLGLNGGSLKDAAGNDATLSHTAVTATPAYKVDTTPPAAPTSLDLASADDSGSNTNDNLTRHPSALTVSGSAEANSSLVLFADGNDDGVQDVGETAITATVDGNGSWSAELTLGEGTHPLKAIATDAAGNRSVASSALSVTIDTTVPTLSSSTPADDVTGIAIDANLTLTFSETVQAGSGNIVIKKTVGDAVVETIAIGSDRVTFDGSMGVTIDPTNDLENSTGYYLAIDSTAIQDEAGNIYAGISDATTLNFETESLPQTLTYVNANNHGGVFTTDLSTGKFILDFNLNGETYKSGFQNQTDLTLEGFGSDDVIRMHLADGQLADQTNIIVSSEMITLRGLFRIYREVIAENRYPVSSDYLKYQGYNSRFWIHSFAKTGNPTNPDKVTIHGLPSMRLTDANFEFV